MDKVFAGVLSLILILLGALTYGQYEMFKSIQNAGFVRESEICYADIYKLAEKRLLQLGLEGKTKQEVQKQMDELIKRLKDIQPEKFGCRFLFIKGALVKGGRDVTYELENYLYGSSSNK